MKASLERVDNWLIPRSLKEKSNDISNNQYIINLLFTHKTSFFLGNWLINQIVFFYIYIVPIYKLFHILLYYKFILSWRRRNPSPSGSTDYQINNQAKIIVKFINLQTFSKIEGKAKVPAVKILQFFQGQLQMLASRQKACRQYRDNNLYKI